MKNTSQLTSIALSSMAITFLLASQNGLAHTRLDVPAITERLRVNNGVVIFHGCEGDKRVIASSAVFPDGVDSLIAVDIQPYDGALSYFVQNWGDLNQKMLSHNILKDENEKKDVNGNVVGFWVGGGKGMPSHYTALLPFRTSAVIIEPESCAISIKFNIAIADICTVTGVDNFTDAAVNLWTPAVGSDFDGPGLHSFKSPASLTVNRDLTANPLPEYCGTGAVVTVTPSATQLNRDMQIYKGKNSNKKFWPT